MVLKIYKPSKTAMQSGKAKTNNWIVEKVSNSTSDKDSLMGWNTSEDTENQIKLFFSSKEKAINWAIENNYQYQVFEPQSKKIVPKNYSDNFSSNRKEPWTH